MIYALKCSQNFLNSEPVWLIVTVSYAAISNYGPVHTVDLENFIVKNVM